ncbi:ROK family transcriptional regulator [Salibacterium qingdaonense]|uniref:ROK family protein (Putative glucokinase) n=1 Tax=Salibacterium qingdaonense TaxID=266892 RepID=A0A1I4P6X3_9BACI|nr:ROK family transcriptional regulator [Salibacterium qingdaonense]SFM23123.1 ROK family protein (putative glucokinase) [Salibacterium qingdaonense]
MKTGDQELVKKINKSIVLQTIQASSPISRAQISKESGLNKATVSGLVSELMEEDFVLEIGTGLSSGGRKPVMLYFNQTAGYAIGIDLGVNYILAVLTDLQGQVVEKIEEPLEETFPGVVLPMLKNIINTLMETQPASSYGVVGIGVGVPGITDNNGSILFAPNLNWEQVNVKQDLEQYFELPVVIENEAKAGAHGENIHGAGRKSSDFVYISLGIGIGTGIIIDDKLYKGARGMSGEMGHISIDANGKKCRCGNKGCWELYSSESTLLEQAAKLPSMEGKELSLNQLIQEAEAGNGEVLSLLSRIGEYVGIGLTNVVNTFNPEQIIIGNRLSKIQRWLENPIHHVLEQRLLPPFYEGLEVSFSQFGIESCALGSAAFSVEAFFSENKVTVT